MFKKITLCMVLLFCIFVLNGCTNIELPPEEDAIAMVIMAGNHANSKNHNVPYYDKIYQVYESFGNIAVVVVDGDPQVVYDEEQYLGCRDSEAINGSKEDYVNNNLYWKSDISQSIKDIVYKINELKSDSPEVNTLSAFRESLKIFNSIGNKNKVILVHDTGLSTDGNLNFVKDNYLELSNEDISILVADLIEKKEIPDFSDVSVIWYGIGDAAYPQEELTELHKDRLRQIWYQIITSGGGRVEFFDVPAQGEFNVEQKVSVVALPEEAAEDEENFEAVNIFFKGDSDKYADVEVAESLLSYISEESKKTPEANWMLIGCAAGNTSLNISQLTDYISADRAIKIKNELITLGMSEAQLQVYSLGPYDPWHIPDSDGTELIEDKAEFNRRVTIIRDDSPEAIFYSEILEQGKLY